MLTTMPRKYVFLSVLFTLAIFTTFIAQIKIYPFLFFIFIFFVIKEVRLDKNDVTLIFLGVLICLLYFLSGFSYSFFEKVPYISANRVVESFVIPYIKLIVNVNFMVFGLIFLKNARVYDNEGTSMLIFRVLGIIVLFSCIQYLYLVQQNNLWLSPFNGDVSSSSFSYVLTRDITVVFGAQQKNIMATKAIFILIIFISLMPAKYRDKKTIVILSPVIFILFFYSFSRTAQIAFLLFILPSLYGWFLEGKRREVQFVYTIMCVSAAVFLLQIFFESFFHFDLSSANDGAASRVVLWNIWLDKVSWHNLVVGSGAMGAVEVLFPMGLENNFHNVSLNIIYEGGLIALIALLGLFMYPFIIHRSNLSKLSLIALLLPFLVVTNSHYLGYDNDLMIYVLLVYWRCLVYEQNKYSYQE